MRWDKSRLGPDPAWVIEFDDGNQEHSHWTGEFLASVSEVCHVFVSQEKKCFFMKYVFLNFALLYSYARVKLDHENHQFSSKNMIFSDFH